MIPDILVAIAICAAAIKARRAEQERRDREWGEDAAYRNWKKSVRRLRLKG